MKTITFKSNSDDKIDLLIKVAREMGVETIAQYSLEEDKLAIPGSKVSEAQLDEWFAKGDGDGEYTTEEMLDYVKERLDKKKREK